MVAAQCGELTVPENPKLPAGPADQPARGRVPAVSRRKQPDPLFVLAGGPGAGRERLLRDASPAPSPASTASATSCSSTSAAPAVRPARLRRRTRTTCSERASAAQIAASTRAAWQRSQRARDVAQYTTSLAVQDLERVRAALGYERINLYGVSYGTRVAQQYLRRFPARVRA